ncbi:MAG: plasmid recombination protein [Lachnospira eligens]
MGNISYTAHVSNKKSAITSKTKLAAVAKHNLRKYKSSDYSKDNIVIVYGTSNLIDDVKTVYHKEFDEALEEYNKKQTRPDRRIEDYFEHVAGKEQDMAVEIIIQIGDREFWKQYDDMKSYMKLSYQIMLDELRKRLPQFVVANAVVHLDEDSPHMHIVGVPMADGYKKGLSKQVSKRKVFTKEVLSRVLQDELREVANKEVNDWFGEQIKEKSKGRNYDLTVAEYKVAQETEHLEQIQEQVNDADIKLFASQIAYKELERRQTKELNEKSSELQSVRQEIASVTDKANEAVELLDKINTFISSFRLFAPAIEEYANHVEADKTIEAGNSFRGILYEIGKLLETFKKLIKEGLCWFPRLMRWKTSKGEVAPVFIEKSNGYSYSVYGYMNVDTKEYYSKELMQREIKAGNRTGTVEQMDANVEAMARDLQEILRIGAEQKRLWEVYKGR